MKKWAVAVSVALVFAGIGWIAIPAQAQSGNSVYVNQLFDFVQPHNGLRTNSYHLAITGPQSVTADLPASALAGGAVTFANLKLTLVGNYTIIVTAIGDGGSTPSDPFALSVVNVPSPPDKPVGGYIVKH